MKLGCIHCGGREEISVSVISLHSPSSHASSHTLPLLPPLPPPSHTLPLLPLMHLHTLSLSSFPPSHTLSFLPPHTLSLSSLPPHTHFLSFLPPLTHSPSFLPHSHTLPPSSPTHTLSLLPLPLTHFSSPSSHPHRRIWVCVHCTGREDREGLRFEGTSLDISL